MKILVSGLSQEKGGIGTLLVNVAECNDIDGERKIEFEYLLPYNSAYKAIFEEKGYVCYIVPRIRHVVAYYKYLKSLLEKNCYDYVWINNTSKVDIILPYLSKKFNVKVIQHSHGTAIEAHGFKKNVIKLLECIYGKYYESLIDVPVACSTSSANYFYRNLEKRKNCMIFNNGVFAHRFLFNEQKRKELRSQLGMSDNKFVFGAVGRLTAVKNYQFLIKLISLLPVNYVCIILGEGDERSVLEKQIIENKIEDRVFLIGDKDNVNEYLSAMDGFLMPSLNEGLPFSLIEAQASGLECIVSDNVSKEVDITGGVHFISLSCMEDWKRVCKNIEIDFQKRLFKNREIAKSGYDINKSYLLFVELLKNINVGFKNVSKDKFTHN